MDDDGASEPVFRANKRRKVFRKRRESDEDPNTPDFLPDATATSTNQAAEDGEDGDTATLKLQKRGGVRKNGIGFSSVQGRRAARQQSREETALVPVNQDVAQEMQNERFIRPMGREMVTEDKHMMAYVDSKLAEMRSTATPTANAPTLDDTVAAAVPDAFDEERTTVAPAASNEHSSHHAQARSDRAYQRPAKRPRKKKYERGEADIARDAYIDQFMQEAQVPLYDRPSVQAARADAGADNDAAAAEAFKAQLLADMETHRRRPPKSATKDASHVTSGPKLGGSRQQREKMRALQEAEGKK